MSDNAKPEHIGVDSLDQATKDRVDLGHEQQGENVGRILRMAAQEGGLSRHQKEQKEKREADFRLTMLEYLLEHDAQYRAAYEKVSKTLDRAQKAVNEAMQEVERRLAESRENLRIIQENAATLEDGTRVYKDAVGNVYTEDGRRLTEEEAASVEFEGDEPSYEDFQESQDAVSKWTQKREELRRYQEDVLDATRERLEDEDNPPSLEELEEFERRIEEEAPGFLTAQYFTEDEVSYVANHMSDEEAIFAMGRTPELNREFIKAHMADAPLEAPVVPDAKDLTGASKDDAGLQLGTDSGIAP